MESNLKIALSFSTKTGRSKNYFWLQNHICSIHIRKIGEYAPVVICVRKHVLLCYLFWFQNNLFLAHLPTFIVPIIRGSGRIAFMILSLVRLISRYNRCVKQWRSPSRSTLTWSMWDGRAFGSNLVTGIWF